MAAALASLEEGVEIVQETLSGRIARASLPLAETLRYAIQLATYLRDLHTYGLAYGAVSPQLVLLGPNGAELRHCGGLIRLGDSRNDVAGFGATLGEMLRATEGSSELLREVQLVAEGCREASLDMQQALIALRLVALRVRQAESVAAAPRERPEIQTKDEMWGLHALLLRWRPLASLAAFAMWGR